MGSEAHDADDKPQDATPGTGSPLGEGVDTGSDKGSDEMKKPENPSEDTSPVGG